MHNWYDSGWIDTRFETRASDMFFKNQSNWCQPR